MRSRPWLALSAAVLAPARAWADPPAMAQGACEHASGVAESQASLLMSPEVFASLGVVSASFNDQGLGSPTPRLLIGADYSVSKLVQGLTLEQRARVECDRARALAALTPAIAQGDELGLLPALRARAQVLHDVLPQAMTLAHEVQVEVQDGRASREELDAISQRLDALQRLTHQTDADQARLAQSPTLSAQEFRTALAAYREADVRFESLNGSLRAQTAWDVGVRGGYERLFDVKQSVPLFGMITLSYNLGGLFQASANRRAVEGVRTMDAVDPAGVGTQVRQLLGALEAQLAAERSRLNETHTRLADLAGQWDELGRIQTHQVDRFRRAVFFELAQTRADVAFLESHVRSLEALVNEGSR